MHLHIPYHSLQCVRSVCMCCMRVVRVFTYCAITRYYFAILMIFIFFTSGSIFLTVNHILLSRWSQGTAQVQTAVPMEVVFGDMAQSLPSSLLDHMVSILYHELNNNYRNYHNRHDGKQAYALYQRTQSIAVCDKNMTYSTVLYTD